MDEIGKLTAIENQVHNDLREKNQEIRKEKAKNDDLRFLVSDLNQSFALESKLRQQSNELIDELQEVIEIERKYRKQAEADLQEEKRNLKLRQNANDAFKSELVALLAEWQISQKIYKNLYEMKAQEVGMSKEEMHSEKEKMKKIIEGQEKGLMDTIKKFGSD